MGSTWTVTGTPDRDHSIEGLAILSIGNLLQVSRHVISSCVEFGDERWIKWMRY